MPDRRTWPAFVLAALAGVFALAAARLLERRLASGSGAYGAYSSQKTDPDGARALFEALGELPGARVRRNFAPIDRLSVGPRGTLLFLGADPWLLRSSSRPEIERLEAEVRSGARLVVALGPIHTSYWMEPDTTPTPKRTPNARPRRRAGRPAEPEDDLVPVSLETRWGLPLVQGAPVPPGSVARLSAEAPPAGLQASVPWRAGVTLERLDPAWRTVYARVGKPVLVERSFGRGTIVFSTDATFASN